MFPHKDIHLHTWTSPNNMHKNQIDHVAINGKITKSVNDISHKCCRRRKRSQPSCHQTQIEAAQGSKEVNNIKKIQNMQT